MSEKVKNKTNAILLDFYNNHNLDVTIKVARRLLVDKGTSPIIRGEVAETVAQIIINDFIKHHPSMCKDWILSKGLILKDLYNSESSYHTELDLTLFTPKRIYSFESKSYKGQKVLTQDGLLKVINPHTKKVVHSFDVYDQHMKHYNALLKYTAPFLVEASKVQYPFKIILFDFSEGSILDKRSSKAKGKFTVRNETNLISLFDSYNSLPEQWDMSYMRKVVSMLENVKEKATVKHRSYVSSLGHNSINRKAKR